jgi:hypothetical protein
MDKNLDHILSRHGILVSFSIARKLSEASILELTEKIKSKSKNKFDFNSKFKDEIFKQSTLDIINGKIPGLINNNPIISSKSKKPKSGKRLEYKTDKTKLSLLYNMISKINTEMLNSNLTANDICFMVYAILNFMEITEEDFKNFHAELNNQNNNPDRMDEDDGYDDGYSEDNRDE